MVNVANLMLARATAREREMALRLSLGAGRGRLVRQLLTESVLLAVLGGAAGLALAWGSIELVRAWNPGNLPLIDSVRLDGRALAFTLLVSMLTGVLFGLAPALESARADLSSTLKEGGRAGAGRTRGRARAVLVVSEISVSLILLVGAGLLLRSFVNLQGVTGGFSTPPRHILTMLISPGNRKYSDQAAGLAFYDEAIRRARQTPGVESAAVTDSLPPDRQGDADTFALEGQTLPPGVINPIISDVTVSPDLFHTMGIPLIRGRGFSDHDRQGSEPVALVSEGFVRRFLPDREALGTRIKQSGPGYGNNWMRIVGVVGNVKYLGLAVDTDPAYYMPFAQSYGPRMFLVVRAPGDAAPLAERLRRDIQAIDPGITLAQIGTMEQALALSVSQPRFDTMLLGLFAAIALLLAAVGIYGLIAYWVAQRTQEIGVRMALGAARADVVRMVIGQGAQLAAIGIAIGLAGAFALTRLLRTMLFGIGVTDAATFVAAAFGLMLTVLLATFPPRASGHARFPGGSAAIRVAWGPVHRGALHSCVALLRAASSLRTHDLAGHLPGSDENKLTQFTENRRGKPGGTDDRFLSSVERLAWREPDRPPKTMVCPTSQSPEHGSPIKGGCATFARPGMSGVNETPRIAEMSGRCWRRLEWRPPCRRCTPAHRCWGNPPRTGCHPGGTQGTGRRGQPELIPFRQMEKGSELTGTELESAYLGRNRSEVRESLCGIGLAPQQRDEGNPAVPIARAPSAVRGRLRSEDVAEKPGLPHRREAPATLPAKHLAETRKGDGADHDLFGNSERCKFRLTHFRYPLSLGREGPPESCSIGYETRICRLSEIAGRGDGSWRLPRSSSALGLCILRAAGRS